MAEHDDYLWDPSAKPDAEVERLERLLRPLAYQERPLAAPPVRRRFTNRVWVPLAMAAALLLAVFVGRAWLRDDPHAWQVAGLDGAPRVDGGRVDGEERLRPGSGWRRMRAPAPAWSWAGSGSRKWGRTAASPRSARGAASTAWLFAGAP
jgi:hypothetical protein